VNDLHEPVRDPHFRARRMVYDVPGESLPRVAEWPAAFGAFASGAPLAPTPRIGQHSREVLAEHGIDDAAINALVEAGVVRQAAASLGLAPCFAGLAEDPPDLTALLGEAPSGAEGGQ
jgi:hypothetical protein